MQAAIYNKDIPERDTNRNLDKTDTMDFKDSKAIYMQIADYFYAQIINGHLKAGERIPSVRDLAAETEVNPNTVMRTYQYLQDNEIIFNKRGIGYFLAEDAPNRAVKVKKDEFVEYTLPEFFKTMEMLDISPAEIEQLFNKYMNNKSNSHINK